MSQLPFDPNGVGIANGNYFGFPYTTEEADLVLLSTPWDVTTSYGGGTSDGPKAIIDASTQLDFYDFDYPNPLRFKIATEEFPEHIQEQSLKLRKKSKKIIAALEDGLELDEKLQSNYNKVNKGSDWLNNEVYQNALSHLKQGKVVGLVGGDHSTPYGLIKALSELKPIGILQIDAHADLRKAYEGFTHSHASIMYNALKLPGVMRLIQVGIRDICEAEVNLAEDNPKVEMFDDFAIKYNSYNGKLWSRQCEDIIQGLPQNVYISFDIDGLKPFLAPNTGTPVAGGLEFHEATFLIKKVVESGRTIVGFDVNEVSPEENGEWNANVGARILYKLCNACLASQKK